MLEYVEGIVSASVKPLENIDEIKIMQLGGSGAAGLGVGGSGGDGAAVGGGQGPSPTDEVINSALRYRVQAPMIDSLLTDIGIDGSDLAKSSVLRDAQDLARAGNEAKRLKRSDAAEKSEEGKK